MQDGSALSDSSTQPVSLYHVVPPSDISRTKPLVRLILNQVGRRLRVLLSQTGICGLMPAPMSQRRNLPVHIKARHCFQFSNSCAAVSVSCTFWPMGGKNFSVVQASCKCCDTRSPPLNQRDHRRRMPHHPSRDIETACLRRLRPTLFFL